MVRAAKPDPIAKDEKLVFGAENKHAAECGEAPELIAVRNDPQYFGYFESMAGDQLTIVVNQSTKQGTLYSGDHGWDKPICIAQGRIEVDALFSAEELQWLGACWRAATGDELE
jgi:hypothetical protein